MMPRKVKYCLLLKMFPKEQASGGNINIKYCDLSFTGIQLHRQSYNIAITVTIFMSQSFLFIYK